MSSLPGLIVHSK